MIMVGLLLKMMTEDMGRDGGLMRDLGAMGVTQKSRLTSFTPALRSPLTRSLLLDYTPAFQVKPNPKPTNPLVQTANAKLESSRSHID